MRLCTSAAMVSIGLSAQLPTTALFAQNADLVLIEDAAAPFAASAQDLTPDGATVVGTSDGRSFRWTAAGGVEFLSPSEYFYTIKAAVSDDGAVVASTVVDGANVVTAARWTQGGGWVGLGCLPAVPPTPDTPAQCSTAWDVSGDGAILVGLGWHGDTYTAEAFRWTQGTGMVGLGKPALFSSRATAIAADGSAAGGFFEDETNGQRRPVRWFGTGAPDFFLGEVSFGEVSGLSSDGTWLTGAGLLLDENGFPLPPWTVQKAFLWSDAEGFRYLLPTRDHDEYGNEWQSSGNGVADNGMVVGWSGSPGPFGGEIVPSLWCPGTERMTDFRGVLAAHGVVPPAGVSILSAEAVTPDGLHVAGQAYDESTYEYVPYVVHFATDPCAYTAPTLAEIPTLDTYGFVALALTLALAALVLLRKVTPGGR